MKRAMASILLCLWGCGGRVDDGPAPQVGEEKVQLLLFAAPWCKPCNQELPVIERMLRDQLAGDENRYSAVVYVVEGDTPTTTPSDASTAAWKAKLGISFDTTLDEWRWKTHQSYFPGKWKIPAAVILNRNKAVVEKFSGSTDLQGILDRLKLEIGG